MNWYLALTVNLCPDSGIRKAVFTVNSNLKRSVEVQRCMYLCFFEYEKAFDRVQQNDLIHILDQLRLDVKDVRVFQSMHYDSNVKLVIKDLETNNRLIRKRFRQTCFKSTNLFKLYSQKNSPDSNKIEDWQNYEPEVDLCFDKIITQTEKMIVAKQNLEESARGQYYVDWKMVEEVKVNSLNYSGHYLSGMDVMTLSLKTLIPLAKKEFSDTRSFPMKKYLPQLLKKIPDDVPSANFNRWMRSFVHQKTLSLEIDRIRNLVISPDPTRQLNTEEIRHTFFRLRWTEFPGKLFVFRAAIWKHRWSRCIMNFWRCFLGKLESARGWFEDIGLWMCVTIRLFYEKSEAMVWWVWNYVGLWLLSSYIIAFGVMFWKKLSTFREKEDQTFLKLRPEGINRSFKFFCIKLGTSFYPREDCLWDDKIYSKVTYWRISVLDFCWQNIFEKPFCSKVKDHGNKKYQNLSLE